MRALVAGNGLQITFGFLVFWMLQGWAVLGETLAPDNPDAAAIVKRYGIKQNK